MSRLRTDVTCCTTENGMVLLEERTGRYWQLNATGASVLQALLEGFTPGQIADQLARTRPVTRDRATADVNSLLEQLTRAGLVAAS
ncbi:lasso peptide biosynthesis PqqD family chaperone [Streptomyces ehimensis]|uniref:Lasso peptide biosynthesis PqqD family chaperone n=1 Tax=Streptomyces ehimensis TaxID=68195 RepID=A0ABV9BU58_9ACTN